MGSLKYKILNLTIIPLTIVLIIVGGLAIYNKIDAERGLFLHRLNAYRVLLESGDLTFETSTDKVKLEALFNEKVEFSKILGYNQLLLYSSEDTVPLITEQDKMDIDEAFRGIETTKKIEAKEGRKATFVIISPLVVNGRVVAVLHQGLSKEKSNQRILEYSIFIGILIFVGIGICFISSLILLDSVILKNIYKLKLGTIEIQKGILDTKIDIKTKDEIGDLAQTFNNMTSDLKRSHEEIKMHSEKLETEVKLRTSELDEEVKELENTKLAILNILEDTDDANKDLTKIKRMLNEKIVQMEDINKKKDEFISITAHELKTPLTSIKGFAELLKNPKISANKKQSMEYFNIIIEDTRRLSELITDMLDITRLDLGTMKFFYEKTTANELITELKNLNELVVKQKGLKLIIDMKKNIPEFYTDKLRVTQILSNFVNNSIKYTEKGSITIEAFKDKEFIHFRNTDTGVGIPKDAQPKIFQRFFQADSSYTRKVGGTGLGLSICKGIAETLGGKIWFKSRPGETVFEFTIKFLSNPPAVQEKDAKI